MASKTTFFKSVVKFVKKNMPTIKKVQKKLENLLSIIKIRLSL